MRCYITRCRIAISRTKKSPATSLELLAARANNKWVAVRLGIDHFKDLIDLSLASHKLSAQTHTPEEIKLCADQAGTHLVPVIKRGRPASEVAMKDPHRIIPIREGWIGSIEERPKYLELKVSQKEKDEREEKQKEAKQKRRKH